MQWHVIPVAKNFSSMEMESASLNQLVMMEVSSTWTHINVKYVEITVLTATILDNALAVSQNSV